MALHINKVVERTSAPLTHIPGVKHIRECSRAIRMPRLKESDEDAVLLVQMVGGQRLVCPGNLIPDPDDESRSPELAFRNCGTALYPRELATVIARMYQHPSEFEITPDDAQMLALLGSWSFGAAVVLYMESTGITRTYKSPQHIPYHATVVPGEAIAGEACAYSLGITIRTDEYDILTARVFSPAYNELGFPPFYDAGNLAYWLPQAE